MIMSQSSIAADPYDKIEQDSFGPYQDYIRFLSMIHRNRCDKESEGRRGYHGNHLRDSSAIVHSQRIGEDRQEAQSMSGNKEHTLLAPVRAALSQRRRHTKTPCCEETPVLYTFTEFRIGPISENTSLRRPQMVNGLMSSREAWRCAASAALFIGVVTQMASARRSRFRGSRSFINDPELLARGQRRDDPAVNLPAGWTQYEDPLTGHFYYFDTTTGVTSWEIPQADTISSLPDCTQDMVKSAYTRCDPLTSSRSLAFFHTTPCKSGVPLPPTVMGLPCNNSCNPGSYLPLGAPTCAPCKPGTYSVGGGVLFTNWEHLPVGMTSYCRFQLEADRAQECSAWVLNGTFIDSGLMRGKRLVDSILEYKVELLRAGSVMFEFRVDAERRWDGLYFAVDGVKKMEMVSYQFQYTPVTIPLGAGFHTLQWVYHKDVAYEMGEDKAWIRSIEVLGTQANVDSCNVCPTGRYSEAGSALCTLCPTNSFADKSGSGTCQPCNAPGEVDRPHMYSYPGSATCSPSIPCVAEDITISYGRCDEATGMRSKTYMYKQPQICFGGAELPASEETTCAPCDPGMYRDGSECVYCPSGTYNPNTTISGLTVCSVCPAGSIAKKVQYFHKAFEPEHFQKLIADGEISTGCANGFCGQDGWRPLGDKIDTGVGNGQVADIWLSLEVVLETVGEISFKFSVRTSNAENILQMYVDDRRMWSLETLQAMSEIGESLQFAADVPAGVHVITWVFHKEREYSWMDEEESAPSTGGEDRATIEEILVTGVAQGGSVKCTPCDAGYYSDTVSSVCVPCQPGYYSASSGLATCTACDVGFFASGLGSTGCQQCGHGTTSEAGASSCNVSASQCRFNVNSNVAYDLSGLARVGGPMWGPVNDPNNSMSYFINLCTQDGSNTTCEGRDGAGIQTFACQQATVSDEFHENYLAVSLGSVMGFYPLETDPRSGLVVSFEGGTPCSNGNLRSLNITMLCDRSAGPGEPTLYPGSAVEFDKCRYHLLWLSEFACPMCSEEDMVAIPGECSITGKRPISMAWSEPKRCYGGQRLPGVRFEDCVAVVLDKTKVAIIVLASSAVFLLLCLALVFLYLRNRKIYREYSVLKEQNEADMELERYTLDEEDQ